VRWHLDAASDVNVLGKARPAWHERARATIEPEEERLQMF
jgi:hypothetical protein